MSRYFEPIQVTPEWKMKLVRMFGKRFITRTSDGIVDYYIWCGRTYINDVTPVGE